MLASLSSSSQTGIYTKDNLDSHKLISGCCDFKSFPCVPLIVISASSCFVSPPFPCGTRVVGVGFIRDLASIFYRIIIVFDFSPLKLIILLGFAFLVICVVVMVSGGFPLGAFVLAALKGLDAAINGSPQALNIIRRRLQTNKQIKYKRWGRFTWKQRQCQGALLCCGRDRWTDFTEGNSSKFVQYNWKMEFWLFV